MKRPVRRTTSSDLTLLLSVITTVIATVIGLVYYVYSSQAVTRELTAAARQTADELSRILVQPLYNYDQDAAAGIAGIYLASGRAGWIRITAPDMGEVFESGARFETTLPVLQKTVARDGLDLGVVELAFDDAPISAARRRAVWTTLVSVVVLLAIYMLALRLILRRILIAPLSRLGSRLAEISGGSYEGRLDPVPQEDLNEIVLAVNRMAAEIDKRTGILQENERNYRTVYDSGNDAIFIHDADDGAIVDVNQAMLEMYGYSRKEIMAVDVDALCMNEPPYSSAEARGYMEKALVEGPQVFTWRARRRDGTLFWVEVALKKARISEMDVILANVRDISDRMELEEELAQARKMEAIGTLAGGIAHDFNNILTSILGHSQLALLKVGERGELREDLRQVERAARRARELVQQILTFSRKQKQVREAVSLKALVFEALQLLRATIPATVEIQTALESEARVRADPAQMLQLIMNLCANGYQAMPDGRGILTVSLRDRQMAGGEVVDLKGGHYAVLEVRDTGEGMDEKTRAKIFEPYFSTKEKGKGTGLGLSTVYGIVESHQGRIIVESRPGAGTTFRVFLPVTDETRKSEPPLSPAVGLRGDKRVLVVDDEDDVRLLIQQVLEHGGYQVDCAGSGIEAWQIFRDDPGAWDLLITDQTMPEMTGVELVRLVLEVRPEMPIVLCTGYSSMVDGERARELGISVYLQKPPCVDELLHAVRAALNREQAT